MNVHSWRITLAQFFFAFIFLFGRSRANDWHVVAWSFSLISHRLLQLLSAASASSSSFQYFITLFEHVSCCFVDMPLTSLTCPTLVSSIFIIISFCWRFLFGVAFALTLSHSFFIFVASRAKQFLSICRFVLPRESLDTAHEWDERAFAFARFAHLKLIVGAFYSSYSHSLQQNGNCTNNETTNAPANFP